jgi:hypothetical protein
MQTSRRSLSSEDDPPSNMQADLRGLVGGESLARSVAVKLPDRVPRRRTGAYNVIVMITLMRSAACHRLFILMATGICH